MLADSSLSIWFSELVQIEAVVAASGEVKVTPKQAEGAPTYALTIEGFWPLGKTIDLEVMAGVKDLAGNPSPVGFKQRYQVVQDPGLLDNFELEKGDLSGFTVNIQREYRQSDPARFFAEEQIFFTGPVARPVRLAEEFAGVEPSQGRLMAVIGDLVSCNPGEVTLTSRFSVPRGATFLSLDYNLISEGERVFHWDFTAGSHQPLISGTLGSKDHIKSFRRDRPTRDDASELSAELITTGFRELNVPVDGLAGQEVIMTLRLRPGVIMGPPPFCGPGVLLLDNLRFN